MNTDSTPSEKSPGGHQFLTIAIVVAIILAIGLALVAPRAAMALEIGGQIFLRLLQMVVVPLVMVSVMSGILGVGDIRKLGKPGSVTLVYFLATTLLAVITGIILVNIIRPGVGMNKALVEDSQKEGAQKVREAQEALSEGGQPLAWGGASTMYASGVSQPVSLSGQQSQELDLTIMQAGVATQPASAVIEWSSDGETFQPLGEPFQAGADSGRYNVRRELPPEAKLARVNFTEQHGGRLSSIEAEVLPAPPTAGDIVKNLVLMLFTNNLLKSMVEMSLLPLIVFSIVFAGMLTTMGAKAAPVTAIVTGINDALMEFILLLMNLAPLGIFCLVAARFGKAQADGNLLELFKVQFYYMLTVLSGLGVHMFISLPLILYLCTRRNPLTFFMQMGKSTLTAFSTASSNATLPVTLECAEKEAGILRRSTEFVIPLGATVNMNGTALYEAAAAIFVAQAYVLLNPAYDLTFAKQVTIAITATLAAVGAAGIPEAGLVTMLIVLNAVGLPLEMIGLILPVDWLLDRFRTAVNVYGDAVGAAVVERTFPGEEIEAAQQSTMV